MSAEIESLSTDQSSRRPGRGVSPMLVALVVLGLLLAVYAHWRFEQFDASTKYWRYGFNGQLGNFLTRVDPMGLRFNFVADLGAASELSVRTVDQAIPLASRRVSHQGGDVIVDARFISD